MSTKHRHTCSSCEVEFECSYDDHPKWQGTFLCPTCENDMAAMEQELDLAPCALVRTPTGNRCVNGCAEDDPNCGVIAP